MKRRDCRAGNEPDYWGCVFCRNQTLQEGAPIQMLNQAMEAIHEVPRMLVDWQHHDVAEVRTHLGGFQTSRWPGAPDLITYFDQRLKEYGHK